MNILMLCEGNPETRDCWSGSAKSVLDELRAQGHAVHTADVDLHGADRWLAAGLAFSRRRDRWGAKYRLSTEGFALRSRRANAAVRSQPSRPDAVLQIGATFATTRRATIPYFLYCDSNIRMAEYGATSGHTDASCLTGIELARIRSREARVYANAAGIFTISERLRRSFIEDFGVESGRVRAVHAGPNFDTTALASRVAAPGAGEHPPTVLFVGRQFERKGGDLLLAAFKTVRERVPDARLVIIGPERLDVQQAGVDFVGFLEKDRADHRARLLDAYANADVFCLPTRFEPFGIVYLEAMYFGLPCVGTSAWAVPEMIADQVSGYTVPVGDVNALSDRLVRLLTDSSLAHRMGEAGRARAENHFTWHAVVERMTDVMERIGYGGAAVA
jgi:glycosyltransferase involved in cell wall biosynthesis